MKKQIRVAFIGLAMLAPTAIADNTGFYAAIGVSSASGERNDARKQLDKDFRIQADETSIQPAFMVGRMLSENFGVEGGLYRSVLTYPKTADLTVVGASDADN